MAERIGIKPLNMCSRVDTLCASGSSSIILAAGLVKSGIADVVAVCGGEKLYTPQMWEAYYSEMASIDHDGTRLTAWPSRTVLRHDGERPHETLRHKKEHLAMISVKARRASATNTKAQFQKEVTMEESYEARPIVPPLSLFDCCPLTDGAAMTILTTPIGPRHSPTAHSFISAAPPRLQCTACRRTGPVRISVIGST